MGPNSDRKRTQRCSKGAPPALMITNISSHSRIDRLVRSHIDLHVAFFESSSIFQTVCTRKQYLGNVRMDARA